MLSKNSEAVWRQPVSGPTAYVRAQQSFGSKRASEQYPCGYPVSLKGTFERLAVMRMMSLLPRHGYILDCPSGTGRVAELLLNRGFEVMATDISAHMVEQCRDNMLVRCGARQDRVKYGVEDVVALSYADKTFDGAICNRLLHHYDDTATRVLALRELARVSRHVVIASFTNSGSASVARKRLLQGRSGKASAVHGITSAQMASEFEAAGMDVVATLPVMGGLSRMSYMAGRPKPLRS